MRARKSRWGQTNTPGMKTGLFDKLVGFAETCMTEYDLNGRTAPDLVNPDRV